MVVVRFLLCRLRQPTLLSSGLIRKSIMTLNIRLLSRLEVTKNITLFSKNSNCKIKNFIVNNEDHRPCVILLSWMMAKRKHMQKFVDYYLKHEFDVLSINITPWQLLWPTKGSQVVASEILKFMDKNSPTSQFLVHGFSVGAYVWSEVMVQIAAEQERYKAVINNIAGQIFDSAADITEISIGLPFAVFPNNQVMQKALTQYIQYHLRTFDRVATRHYVRASQIFHTNVLKAPTLLLLSKTDRIGALSSNLRAKETMENMGIKVHWKCWDKSPHVGHYHKHPEEYIECLNKFIDAIGFGRRENQKIRAKL